MLMASHLCVGGREYCSRKLRAGEYKYSSSTLSLIVLNKLR